MQSQALHIDLALLKKYAVPGPRYTSYPTAPMFSETFGWAPYVQALEDSNRDARPLSLYVHLPYCKSRCWYCGCNMAVTHSQDRIRSYLGYVQREVRLLASYLRHDRQVVQVHWGGGSPSYLSPTDKTALMTFLQDHFAFAPDAEIGTELKPRDLRPGEANMLRRLGFNRISLGVQDLNPEVQHAVNRVHSEALVVDVVQQLREAGFDSLRLRRRSGTAVGALGRAQGLRPGTDVRKSAQRGPAGRSGPPPAPPDHG